jgi:hypothetical protein
LGEERWIVILFVMSVVVKDVRSATMDGNVLEKVVINVKWVGN